MVNYLHNNCLLWINKFKKKDQHIKYSDILIKEQVKWKSFASIPKCDTYSTILYE